MQVVGCQVNTVWENKNATHERVRSLLHGAWIEAGALVVLPEMFATGFSLNIAAIAEDENGPTHLFLAQLARDLGAFVLGGVVTHGRGRKGRNELVVFAPDGQLRLRYCKLFPFTFGNETQHYDKGSDPGCFRWEPFLVAPFICYDLRFPEIFRIGARRGAQLMPVVANWPAARQDHWMTLLKARAIENQSYVMGVNRCGRDPNLAYSGRSMVIDPRGEVLADAGNAECVLTAEIELAPLLEYREKFPALGDIRPEFLASPLRENGE